MAKCTSPRNGTSSCAAPTRIWRLRENVLGFKSADKLRPNWRHVFPRYSRLIEGPVVLLHSYDQRGVSPSRNVCHVLNEHTAWNRLIVQPRPGTPYQALLTRGDCVDHLSALSPARFVPPLCGMLPEARAASHRAQLVEPLNDFWQEMRRANLTFDMSHVQLSNRFPRGVVTARGERLESTSNASMNFPNR